MNYLKLTTYRAGMLQAKAYRNLSGFMTKTLAVYGLAVTEWALLGLLKDEGELRPNALSEHLGVTNPLTSRHIKHLADLGYLERIDLEHDARGATIKLSDTGETMLMAVEKELRKDMREYLKGISLRQLAAYLSVLEQLAERNV